MIRKPAVSGQFYPSDKRDLEATIDGFKPKRNNKISAKGIILPHAGYAYSGRVAVETISRVLAKKKLILLGPNHTGLGEKFSLWGKGKWETPLASINIDEELSKRILGTGSLIAEDKLAHQHEHSLEVQLPILYRFFGQFSFVPIACQQASLANYRKVAAQICQAIKAQEDEVLFIASTDLTHYEPDITARVKDRTVIEAIINLDEEELLNKVKAKGITMCGVAPVAILLCCLKAVGAKKAEVCLYQTSGDAGGDKTSVVGYVGMIIK
ncbi:MAG: AmmeMemoRadiSam system protein B [Candidatus Omnitrophica bacterium]|nr:AmmeMemoRadiSam system protein B [Candidatus Omnitrophota bacterium]